jgi:hypothetical protein
VSQIDEDINVELAAEAFLRGDKGFDARLLTATGLESTAKARGLSPEQTKELQRQQGLVNDLLAKRAADDTDPEQKRANELLKVAQTDQNVRKEFTKALKEERNRRDKRGDTRGFTPADFKRFQKEAEETVEARNQIAEGKGVEKAVDNFNAGLKGVAQAQKQQEINEKNNADRVRREVKSQPQGQPQGQPQSQSQGQLNQTQRQDVQQQQARAAQEAAKAGKANAATSRKTERTNRQGFQKQEQTTQDRTGELTEITMGGFLGLAKLLQSGRVLVKDQAAHIIALGGFQSLEDRLDEIIRATQGAVVPQSKAVDFGNAITALQGAGQLTYSRGGVVYANEGTLVNYQPKGTDTVPAMLTPGEFVVRKSSVDKYGTGMMKAINSGSFANGGKVNYLQGGGNALFRPGLVTATTQLLSESVRNFGSFLSGGSLDNFASSVNTLVSSEGFGAFSQAVNKFEEIPKEFTMTVAPTQVTVSINGAEILAQIMPEIQSEILSQTSFKIEEFRQQLKSGDV